MKLDIAEYWSTVSRLPTTKYNKRQDGGNMSTDLVGSVPWRSPVLIRIGHGSSEAVNNPADALHYMIHRWPQDRGNHYANVMRECKKAAEGLVAGEVAKEAFIAAAIEAYVLA
jgi:hypothetical protein